MRIISSIGVLICSLLIPLSFAAPAEAGYNCDYRHRVSKWTEYPDANLIARARVNYSYCTDGLANWYYSINTIKYSIDRSGWRTYGCTDADQYKINVTPVGGVNPGTETWNCRDGDPHYERKVSVFQKIYPAAYSNDNCFNMLFTEVLYNQPDRVHHGTRKCI